MLIQLDWITNYSHQTTLGIRENYAKHLFPIHKNVAWTAPVIWRMDMPSFFHA